MHPLSDEDLVSYLTARPDGPDRGALAAHLSACPGCARRAAALAAWERALALVAEGRNRAPEEVLRRLRGRHPRLFRAPFRLGWKPAWAAAALLLATAALCFRKGPLSPAAFPSAVREPGASEALERPRLLSPASGVEILLAPGSRLLHQPRAGCWDLARGACLVVAEGGGITVSAAGLEVGISSGEVAVRMLEEEGQAWHWPAEALAASPVRAEVLVLSGKAELEAGGQRLTLVAGEGVRGDARAVERRTRAAGEQARLREAFLAAARLPGDSAENRLLDARKGFDAWLSQAPSDVYQAVLRVRALERPSALGLSFEVDGRPSFWDPRDPGLLDGAWHTLSVTLSPNWVTLACDGALRNRVARREFKVNPLTEASGVGVLAWGGRLEVSQFRVVSLR